MDKLTGEAEVMKRLYPHTETRADGVAIGSKDYSNRELAVILRSYAETEGDEDLCGYLLWAAEKLEGV